MIIKKIEIGAFGKLEKYEVELENGVQVVVGPNEFGKSTLMEFLKLMFYSRRSGEKSGLKDKELRRKYTPWSGAKMNGSVELVHKGNCYRIQKEISCESPAKDIVSVRNLSSGEVINLGKKEEAGEYLFGIDVKSFERSSYIANIGKADFELIKNSKDTLADKIISNLSDTGEEEVSKSLTTKRISEAIKDLKRARGEGGKIFESKGKINELTERIYDLKRIEEDNEKSALELDKIKILRKEQKELLNKLEDFEKYCKRSKVNEIIRSMQERENIIRNLRIELSEVYKIIRNSLTCSEKLKSYASTLCELQNLIDSVNDNISPVSDREMDEFGLVVCEKELVEKNLAQINIVLKNYILNPEINFLNSDMKNILSSDIFSEISKNFDKCEKLKADFCELNNEFKGAQINLDELEKEVSLKKEKLLKLLDEEKKKKQSNRIVQILNTVVFLGIGAVGFFVFNSFLPFLIFLFPFTCCWAWGILLKVKRQKILNTLNSEITKTETENKKICEKDYENIRLQNLTVKNNLDDIKEDIRKLLDKAVVNAEIYLDEKEKTIKYMLTDKKCESIQDYYENNARFQGAEKIRNSYKLTLSEKDNIERELVDEISKYKVVTNIEEALTVLKELALITSKIKFIDEKVNHELKFLNFENTDIETLEKYVKNISINEEVCMLSEDNIIQMKMRLEYLKNLNLEEKYIEVQKSIKPLCESVENLDNELKNRKDKLLNMEMYLKSLQIALSVLEESSDELRKTFNPKLDLRASEIFSKLTNNRYKELHVDKKYDIVVTDEFQEHPCEDFSNGTIDQAYFSLRLAVAELIGCENHIPVFLDDSFIQYDDKRLETVMNFLKDYSQNKTQIIIFTCHDYVAQCAAKIGAKIIGI